MNLRGLAAILGVAACLLPVSAIPSQAQDISRQVAVTSEFWDGKLQWTNQRAGYFYKYFANYVDGQVEICGVGAYTNAYTRRADRELMTTAKLTMDDKVILQDLSYFARVNTKAELASATANCRRTGAAAPRQQVWFKIEFSNKRFSF